LGGASTIIEIKFKEILDEFMKASRGKINRQKNHVYAWNINFRVVASIVVFFNSLHWKIELPSGIWGSLFVSSPIPTQLGPL
jgi:hypothetical protein